MNIFRQVELVMLINFAVFIEHLSLTVFKIKAEIAKFDISGAISHIRGLCTTST
jgi:hypothetical protein